MKKRIVLFFIYFLSCDTFANDKYEQKTWMYEKVSGVDVFDKHDVNVINNLNVFYSKVTIKISGENINIKNDFLEDEQVCSIDYVKIKKRHWNIFCHKTQLICTRGCFIVKVSIFQNIYRS